MRILAVTNIYPTAQMPSSGVFVEQQINGLVKAGTGVDLLVVKRLERGMASYCGLRQEIQLRMLQSRPDIVHVMYGGVMADIVTRAVTDCPTIVTFHGSDLLGEHLSGRLRQLIANFGVWASWRAARRASGIIAVSDELRDALPKDIDRNKVRIIPCGIDLERFKPIDRDVCRQQLGWDDGKFNVLFATNGGDPVKRFELAQAAVQELKERGVATRLHQLRNVENRDVPVWLNASDVLLLTSHHEGSPTIVKEALACNLPVVSVPVGDVRERIHGIKGCHLAASRPYDLASKLFAVYSSNRRVDARSKMQAFSVEAIAAELQTFYEDVSVVQRASPKF